MLTIAGSDPSGGAGIQADLKTFHVHGVFGQAVVTLLTVQSTRGVSAVHPLPAALVAQQLREVLEDTPPVVIKIGALADAATIDALAAPLRERPVPVVVDPVLGSTGGFRFVDDRWSAAMRAALLPCTTLITPNLAEAQVLTGRIVRTRAQAREAAEALRALGAHAALVTGGHLEGAPVDWLALPEGTFALEGERVATTSTHGTGCALTAAIASRLARGTPLYEAVVLSKRWVTEALRSAPGLGAGHGPLNFFAPVD